MKAEQIPIVKNIIIQNAMIIKKMKMTIAKSMMTIKRVTFIKIMVVAGIISHTHLRLSTNIWLV